MDHIKNAWPPASTVCTNLFHHNLAPPPTLKVHNHEILLHFFDINQILICPSYIFKNNFASFPSIFARVSMFEHFRGDWAYAEPNFFWEISNKFVFQNIHFGPIRRFFKVLIFYRRNCILIRDLWVIFENYSMCMLSIRGNDFIACCAYEKRISSHAEHTRNKFLRMLSQR
jgi:hypothetical protein